MNTTHNWRILIADDEQHIRSALRLRLEQEPQLQVVAEAATANGLLISLEKTAVDVLLLDWDLPGLPIRHLLRLLRMEWPQLRIIAMSSQPEARRPALQAGAAAFLNKGAPPETILSLLAALPPAAA